MFVVQLTFVERSLISHIDPPTGPVFSGQRKFRIGMNLGTLVDVAELVSANRLTEFTARLTQGAATSKAASRSMA